MAGRQNKIRKRVWKWEKEYVQKRLPVVEYQQGASYADEMIEINAYLGMLRNHLRRKEILGF